MTKRERHNARMREDRKKHGDKRRAADREAYARNRDRVYRQTVKRRYRLTDEQIEYLCNSAQCDICGHISIDRKLMIDHDHSKGINRGILCLNCNAGLGHFRDNPRLLAAAIRYLENGGSGVFGNREH